MPLCEPQLPLCEAQLPLCEAQLPFSETQKGFCRKVKLRTYLSQNFNLRTSEAHFIKQSAVRCTAATCDSLLGGVIFRDIPPVIGQSQF